MKVTPIETNGRCGSEVAGFLPEKLEQDHQFRSEDLQEQNNEREAQERQHHQLIKNQQMQAQPSQTIQVLQQKQTQILALLMQTVK